LAIPRAIAVVACASLVAAAGCDKKRLVINASFAMVGEAVDAFFEESDTALAAEAAPANLKLIEGMARGSPRNPELLLVASQMFGMYAFGFLEDRDTDGDERRLDERRAKGLYLRGKAYALAALDLERDFDGMLSLDQASFERALQEIGADDVPGLFWLVFNWGLYVNLSRDDLAAISERSKIAAIAERIVELDEGFYYGGAHMFLMVYYGTLGRAIGGDPERAKAEFEKARAFSRGKFLMTDYLFAETYCLQVMDRALFEKTLRGIIDAPDGLPAEQRLANALAKEKAARLLARADELF